MPGRNRLANAFHDYKVNIPEYLERMKVLDGKTEAEKETLRDELAEWIEQTCPPRKRKPPTRDFSESEMHAVNVIFNDSIDTCMIMAGGKYQALEYARKTNLLMTSLDVGYLNEPEDSDYRRIVSLRAVLPFLNETDEELLEWYENYRVWERFFKAMSHGESFRIWYSENPRELCAFYYLCSLLKDYSGDVYAVRAPERIRYQDDDIWHTVYRTGQLGADNLGWIIESAMKLSPAEIGMYAKEWERLKMENAPLRTVLAGQIVSVQETFYDPFIWRQIPTEPTTEMRVTGNIMSAVQAIPSGWITQRIQKMIDNGRIEIVEDNDNLAKRLIRRK